MNYYIEKDGKIVLADNDKERMLNTLPFMPQYEGLLVQETEREIVSYGGELYFADEITDELLEEAKTAKYKEANEGARKYLEEEALYEVAEGKHIEATDGNIAKLTAYALAFVTGQLAPEDVVYWNTKEDATITLTQTELSDVLVGLGEVQAQVWNVKFPAYLEQIEACETVEEVGAIVIDYSAAADAEEEPEENNTYSEENPEEDESPSSPGEIGL